MEIMKDEVFAEGITTIRNYWNPEMAIVEESRMTEICYDDNKKRDYSKL